MKKKKYPLTVKEALSAIAKELNLTLEEVDRRVDRRSALHWLGRRCSQPHLLTQEETTDFGPGTYVLMVRGSKAVFVLEPKEFRNGAGKIVKTVKVTTAGLQGRLKGKIRGTRSIRYFDDWT